MKKNADFQDRSERALERESWTEKPPASDKAHSIEGAWTDIKSDLGRTDRANARRFLKRYGDQVRFCFSWNRWLIWSGTHWQIDEGGAILRLAMTVADSVWLEARGQLTREIATFAVQTSSAGRLAAMLKLAAADVPIATEDLDSNPWLLNCPNGTLDLRTGELRPPRREDCITKICPTIYDRSAVAPNWELFLAGVFGDSATVDFVQRFAGYCLTGSTAEQILTVLWGTGSNGKSTLLNALQDTIGGDYAMAAPAGLLTVKKTDAHPTELADLFGKRFVVSQETEDGGRLAESLVKQLTGGDKIRARRMRQDFWEFVPTHKLAIVTNHKPKVRGGDHSIWRRIVLIPFVSKFWNRANGEIGPVALEQDKELPSKLKAESAGILAWAIGGCLDWQRGGLRIPETVRAATAEYRSENDTLGRFVAECCLTGSTYRAKFSAIYEALQSWCDDSGENLPNRRFVGRWLKDHEFREHSSNGRWYFGVAIKHPDKTVFFVSGTDRDSTGTVPTNPDRLSSQVISTGTQRDISALRESVPVCLNGTATRDGLSDEHFEF